MRINLVRKGKEYVNGNTVVLCTESAIDVESFKGVVSGINIRCYSDGLPVIGTYSENWKMSTFKQFQDKTIGLSASSGEPALRSGYTENDIIQYKKRVNTAFQ